MRRRHPEGNGIAGGKNYKAKMSEGNIKIRHAEVKLPVGIYGAVSATRR